MRSPGISIGYLDAPNLTAERFGPDGLRTGDLGFANDGHPFLTGRQDDLMSVAGRNIFAQDIEQTLAGVTGVRPGACSVVDVAGRETPRLVAVIEARPNHPDLGRIAGDALDVTRAIMA